MWMDSLKKDVIAALESAVEESIEPVALVKKKDDPSHKFGSIDVKNHVKHDNDNELDESEALCSCCLPS